MRCVREGCEAVLEPASKWVKIRAHEAGWFFQRDGKAFCPEHRPDYAPARP